MKRLTALLATHNRVDSTMRCLQHLRRQDVQDLTVDAVVVDAASTDGTAEAVERLFPEAEVVRVGSDIFWNGGMRVAFEHARRQRPDYYLWLNDDTLLDDDALRVLLDTERQLTDRSRAPAIVVGSTRDPVSGALTYGGVRRPDRRRPLRFEILHPDARPVECETMNGNVVLVSHDVTEAIGVLDERFTHGMGDFDYGLRARQAGCSVWIAPGTVGTCARNAPADVPTVGAVIRRLRSPKGLPPREWAAFARRWAGPLWPLYAISPYVRRIVRVARR